MAKIQHVHWLGTGPITFELPARGERYTFQPKIRNQVDGDVWADLINPINGPARLYLAKKKLRPTTPGGGADVEKAAAVSRAIAPAAPMPMPSQDAELRMENTQLKSEVRRLGHMLNALSEAKAAEDKKAESAPEPDMEPEADIPEPEDEPEDSPEAPLDPHSMSVDALEEAIKGLPLEALEQIHAAELAGKSRKGAIAAIEAEQDRALARD